MCVGVGGTGVGHDAAGCRDALRGLYTGGKQSVPRRYSRYTGCTQAVHRRYRCGAQPMHRRYMGGTQAVHRRCRCTAGAWVVHRRYTGNADAVNMRYTAGTEVYTACGAAATTRPVARASSSRIGETGQHMTAAARGLSASRRQATRSGQLVRPLGQGSYSGQLLRPVSQAIRSGQLISTQILINSPCRLLMKFVAYVLTRIILKIILTLFMRGFELCVFVAGWRHALRSEWPFIIIIIYEKRYISCRHLPENST